MQLYIEKGEAVEIVISVLAISLAFTIVFFGLFGLLIYPKEALVFIGLCIVTVGSGFIFHEMAHKVVAIYYGAYARFNMWMNGLVFMLLTSVFRVLFAAPGAVYIYSRNITKKENGIISIAGAVTNILIMLVFMLLAVFVPVKQFFVGVEMPFFGIDCAADGRDGSCVGGALVNYWAFGAGINLMLAMFNMLPVFPLDGSKVYAWSRLVWGLFIAFILGFGAVFFTPTLIIGWVFMLVIVFVFSKFAFGR